MTHLPTIKPLSATEERTLLALAQAGDRDAEATLALSQEPAIRRLARQAARGSFIEFDDVVQKGLEAYIIGLRSLELRPEGRIWTALVKSVKRAVLAEVTAHRFPTNVEERAARLYLQSVRETETLAEARVWAGSTDRGVGVRMSGAKWDAVHSSYTSHSLWTGGEGGEDDWMHNGDVPVSGQVVETNALVPFSSVEDRDEVKRLLAVLDDRSKTILGMAYGFAGEPMTDGAIAAELGLSRPRVANIRLAALASLRGESK